MTGLQPGAQLGDCLLADKAFGIARAADDGAGAVDDGGQPAMLERLPLQQLVQLGRQHPDIQAVDDLAIPAVHRHAHGDDRFAGDRALEQTGQHGPAGGEHLGQQRRIAALRQGLAEGAQGIDHLAPVAVGQYIVVDGL